MKATNSLAASCWNECPKFPKSCNHDVRSYCVLPGILGFSLWESNGFHEIRPKSQPKETRFMEVMEIIVEYCWVKCPVFDNHHIQITGHHDFSYYWTSYYYFHNDIQWLFMYLHCHLHHLLQAPLTMWKTPVFDTPWREIARSVWQEARLHIECQGDLYAIPSPFGDRKGIYQLWKTGHFLGIPWGYHGDTTDWQQKWLVGFVAVLACSETRPWP